MSKSVNSKRIHQMTVKDFEALFPNEEACDAYLVRHRWPTAVRCPRCGSDRVYELQTMPFKWECSECGKGNAYRFSHLVGTIFENTNVNLREWFRVIHMMLTSKKGVSALQVKRVMGFGSYKTAWYMCHRIRAALQEKDFQKLLGIVEVDETYIGGKSKNKHKGKRNDGERGPVGKDIVIGAVRRKGNIVARVIASADRYTVGKFIREAISTRVKLMATDNNPAYRRVAPWPHGVVNHNQGQYVHGNIHTNTIEGFWSILKRGVVGTFHKVSAKYLPLYVAEFQFRYNNRHNDDIFGAAIAGC
jgi:transposase-like protein/IS1 family transposase